MKFWFSFSIILLITGRCFSQQSSDYVSLHGKQFELHHEPFFPLTMNYGIDILHDLSNNYFISPSRYNVYPFDYPSTNKNDCFQDIVDDFTLIKNLGFNSVRIIGFSFGQDKLWNQANLSLTPAYVSYNTNCGFNGDCSTGTVTPQVSPYTDFMDYIEDAIDAAEIAGLKVQLLVGAALINSPATESEFENYLDVLSTHFANNTTLYSYDLLNEPHNGASKSTSTKQQVCYLVETWNSIIKSNDPWHLTTIGLLDEFETELWDPSILKVDFLSFHCYPSSATNWDDVKRKIKWYGETSKLPWIIGETGLAATTHSGLSGTGTLQQQQDYAKMTMEMTRDCGGSGYSWWQYGDQQWDVPIHQSFGVIDGYDQLKPVASEFALFDPFILGSTCVAPSTYYSSPSSGTYSLSGVVGRQLYPLKAVSNAVIAGFEQDTIIDTITGNPLIDTITGKPVIKWVNPVYAYSKPNGLFSLYSNNPINVIVIHTPGGSSRISSLNPANNSFWLVNQFIPSTTIALSNVTIASGQSVNHHATNSVTASTVTFQGNGTSGASGTLNGTNVVKLNPGFVANRGSFVHIYNGAVLPDCSILNTVTMAPLSEGHNDVQLNTDSINETDFLAVENSSSPEIVIAPNPTNGLVTISVNDNSFQIESVKIYNSVGQILLDSPVQFTTKEFDLSSYDSGVYTIRLSSQGKSYTYRVLKHN